MLPELTVIPFVAEPEDSEKEDSYASERDRLRAELRRLLDEEIRRRSGGRQKRMRYCADGYAKYIVIKCKLKLEGWPDDVPFRNLSKAGGIRLLRELHRRWHLEEGNAERLRFEPATAEDRANAERDPASVIPNAALQEREASPSAPRLVVRGVVLHPHTADVVGVHHTSTESGGAAPDSEKARREQRYDFGMRRRPLMHPELKRAPRRGVTSLSRVIPGVDSDSEERPAKRARADCAVDDRIERLLEYKAGEDVISSYSVSKAGVD